MKNKYAPSGGKQKGTYGQGRYVDPSKWITGPDPLTREKYYSYLKHRSQARFRSEDYGLTWEQWQAFWPDEAWSRRGQKNQDLVLGRVDWNRGWHEDNVEIMTRQRHFEIRKSHGYRKTWDPSSRAE